MTEYWTEQELRDRTGKKQPAAQMRALRMAIPPIPFIQLCGKPLVRRSDVVESGAKVKLNWE